MFISRFSVANYQCFDQTDDVCLDRGLNLIVGRNNAGKSALLRALSMRAQGSPHRSARTRPHPSDPYNQNSILKFEVVASGQEVRRAMFKTEDALFLPAPSEIAWKSSEVNTFCESIFAKNEIHFEVRTSAKEGSSPVFNASKVPVWDAYDATPQGNREMLWVSVVPNREKNEIRFNGVPQTSLNGTEFGVLAARWLCSGIYKFDAERLSLAKSNTGESEILNTNASNLAEVLGALQKNPARFRAYDALVREVFPTVRGVSVRPRGGNHVEVLIWQIDPESERDDLAVSLEDCGTGIGQVLAILYVVRTSESPRTICIDEPNSFLHPGASRALVRILKRFPQHQYLVATHAPEVINEVGAARILQLVWRDSKSNISQFDTATVEIAGGILGDLGARLSDVLGYERIVWVEGPSDADAWLAIDQQLGSKSLNTVFLPVRSTSSFEKPDLGEVLHIHRSLSQVRAPTPPHVAFVLDREERSAKEIADITRESHNTVKFLTRRMFENYLLNAEAIASLLNLLEKEASRPISVSLVSEWIASNGAAKRYSPNCLEPFSADWLVEVHSARLLSDLVSSLTEQRHVYRKTTHTLWLTKWHLDKCPDALSELAEIMRDALLPKNLITPS